MKNTGRVAFRGNAIPGLSYVASGARESRVDLWTKQRWRVYKIGFLCMNKKEFSIFKFRHDGVNHSVYLSGDHRNIPHVRWRFTCQKWLH